MSALSDLLRGRRYELGLSLQDLCDRTGFSKSHLCEIERGHSEPGVTKIAVIAKELRLSARSVFDAALAGIGGKA